MKMKERKIFPLSTKIFRHKLLLIIGNISSLADYFGWHKWSFLRKIFPKSFILCGDKGAFDSIFFFSFFFRVPSMCPNRVFFPSGRTRTRRTMGGSASIVLPSMAVVPFCSIVRTRFWRIFLSKAGLHINSTACEGVQIRRIPLDIIISEFAPSSRARHFYFAFP